MALYTLYPCKPDGTSESFVTLELADDAAAEAAVTTVPKRHPSATEVAIWCGDRFVGRLGKARPEQDAA